MTCTTEAHEATRTRTAPWSAWHLYLATAAVPAADRVVLDTVAPIVEALPEHRWFFIRYWQGGPHVRLRIAGLTQAQASETTTLLAESLRLSGVPRAGEPPLDGVAFQGEAARHARAESGPDGDLTGMRPFGVEPCDYKPELERYGGAALMPASEDVFQLSSRICVAILRSAPSGSQRAAAALRLAMSAATSLGDPADQAMFYAIGRQAWHEWAIEFGYPEELVSAALAVQPGPGADPYDHGAFAPWHDALVNLGDRIREETPERHPGSVVSSQVHMTHNRLGLGILEELRTYAWLAAAFPTNRATG